jgi:hypothetical protein
VVVLFVIVVVVVVVVVDVSVVVVVVVPTHVDSFESPKYHNFITKAKILAFT